MGFQRASIEEVKIWLNNLPTSQKSKVIREWTVAILKEEAKLGEAPSDDWGNDYLIRIFESIVPQTIILSK